MSFFNNPEVVFYLKPERLEVYSKNQAQKLDFPEDIVSFQEVLSPVEYQKLLAEFFTSLGLVNKKIAILISKELLYEKTFAVEAKKEEIDSFLKAVPLEKLSQIDLTNGQQKLLIATNYSLIKPILEVTDTLKLKVLKVIPASLMNINPQTSLDQTSFNQVINEKLPSEADFLPTLQEKEVVKTEEGDSETEASEAEDQAEGNKSAKIAALIIALLILASGLAYIAHTFEIITLPFLPNNKQAVITPSPSPEPSISPEPSPQQEATASAEIVTIPKEELTLKIFNGTGTAGKAAQVSNILTSIGYKNITTENAEGTGSRETVVIFSTRVSSAEKAEILAELDSLFATTAVQEDTPEAEFDVLITTGSSK